MPGRITFHSARAEAARRPAGVFRDGGHAITPKAAERARTRPCALLRDMVEYFHLMREEVAIRAQKKTNDEHKYFWLVFARPGFRRPIATLASTGHFS